MGIISTTRKANKGRGEAELMFKRMKREVGRPYMPLKSLSLRSLLEVEARMEDATKPPAAVVRPAHAGRNHALLTAPDVIYRPTPKAAAPVKIDQSLSTHTYT